MAPKEGLGPRLHSKIVYFLSKSKVFRQNTVTIFYRTFTHFTDSFTDTPA